MNAPDIIRGASHYLLLRAELADQLLDAMRKAIVLADEDARRADEDSAEADAISIEAFDAAKALRDMLARAGVDPDKLRGVL